MQDYTDFPPVYFLERTLKFCPKCTLIYVTLWREKISHKRLHILKKNIKRHFFLSPTIFRNFLISLSQIDLLNFEETENGFFIDFYEDKDA